MILNLTKIALLAALLSAAPCHGSNSKEPQILTISPQIALPIGIKIWFNESGGSIEGLTCWNKNEDFASLGIGHSLWHPYPSKRASSKNGFPRLLNYIKANGTVRIPNWLQGEGSLYCPWSNRSEFTAASHSSKMRELRKFLQQSIPIQAEYMTKQLQETLPEMLASAPMEDRQFIYEKFYSLARTPAGVYALVDYLNFKGAGIYKSQQNYKNGSGLLQVLRWMKYAPRGSTPLQAYVWSAKKALLRRVDNADSSKNHEVWVPGWFKRIDTYLEGDFK